MLRAVVSCGGTRGFNRRGRSPPAAEARSVIRRGPVIFEALGNLGDFIGGVAVVVTIGYLAIQVRQNTAVLRSQSRQQVVQNYREYMGHFINDPALNGVLLEGLRSYPDLELLTRQRFYNLITDLALHFQSAVALFESGTLDETTFRAYRDHFASVLSTPGGAAFWNQARSGYPSHVAESVEERLGSGSLPDILANPTWGE
jgi:hypothetical protein